MTIEEQIQKKVEEQRAADQAGAKAIYDPLPGPLAEIFPLNTEIPVSVGKIRAFRDRDFQWLKLINHPLYHMMINSLMKVAPSEEDTYLPVGQHAWNIAWLLSHSVNECKALLKERGVAGLEEKAEEEFGDFTLPQMTAIHIAVMEQVRIYTSGIIEHGAQPKEGEQSHPPSMAPSTVLGGS